MRVSFLLVATIAVFMSTSSAWAELSDEACRDRNGLAINSKECVEFRKTNKALSDTDCFDSDACRREKEAASETRRTRQEQIKKSEQETIRREEAITARKAAAAESTRKAKCGEDYKKPRIGMPIDRVQECVAPARMTGQLNRADGVVSTYEGGGAYFNVMQGRVVSWGWY